MREIVSDKEGTKKFKMNRLVQFLYISTNDEINLNKIWEYYDVGLFTMEEMKEFYQLIGYPVNGYEELFGELDET